MRLLLVASISIALGLIGSIALNSRASDSAMLTEPTPEVTCRVHIDRLPMEIVSVTKCATDIVDGRIMSKQQVPGPNGLVRTRYSVKVSHWLKIDPNADPAVVAVPEPGDEPTIFVDVAGGVESDALGNPTGFVAVPDAPDFALNEEAVLFLWRDLSDPDPDYLVGNEMVFGIVGLHQGVVRKNTPTPGGTALANGYVAEEGETFAELKERVIATVAQGDE